MKIKITEEQMRYFTEALDVLQEGIQYTYDGNGPINMTVDGGKGGRVAPSYSAWERQNAAKQGRQLTNIDSRSQYRTDKDNTGANSVDTRAFGTKHDVLYGDGTNRGNSLSLTQKYNARDAMEQMYQDVIEWVQNGRKGNIRTDGVPEIVINSLQKNIKKFNDEKLLAWATKRLNDHELENEIMANTIDRATNAQNDTDKIAKYNVGTVPQTNVKFIALFTMTDFNFSDAIKNGQLRQNGNTDKLLGINKSERAKIGRNYEALPVTYDDGVQPNIANNFSLDGVKDGHFKQQYGMYGEGGYTSVTQFMDKSIQYAAYALKQENYRPDFIIAAPSSSKFNNYFCTNLSNKLGVPFVKDFFKRNVVNVRYKDQDADVMANDGFTPTEIEKFKQFVKKVAYNEISYLSCNPVRQFVEQNRNVFGNIPVAKYSRSRVKLQHVLTSVTKYAFQCTLKNVKGNVLTTHLVENFMKDAINAVESSRFKGYGYSTEDVYNKVCSLLTSRALKAQFEQALQQMQNIILQYAKLIFEKGYKVNYDATRFKITKLDKRFRPYLHDVYIIADKALTTDKNNKGSLLSRYQNGKFLIYDEDINSGGTLKLVIDVLQEKLPSHSTNNILCMTNAYSASGK